MNSQTLQARRWLPLLIGIAIGIRVMLALVMGQHEAAEPGAGGGGGAGKIGSLWFADAADYDQLARAILEHRPYEVGGNLASRMPGYPIFVAAVYAVCGYSPQAVLIVQALLAGGIVALAYAIGRRGGVAMGLLAAGLAAVDPLTIGFSITLLSETGFTFLLMLAVWVGIRIVEARSGERLFKEREVASSMLSGAPAPLSMAHDSPWTRGPISIAKFLGAWAGLGLIWGAAVYFRASAMWCIVPLAGVLALVSRGLPMARRIAGPSLAVLIVFLTLTPWLVRNYQHFGSGPFRLTTLEGISLYEAVYPEADGGPKQDQIPLPAEMTNLSEAQRNDEWSHRAWQYVRADPARIMRLGLIKAGRTWSPWFNLASLRRGPIQVAMILWHVPLFILGLIGLLAGPLPRSHRIVLLIPVAYFTLVHSLFLGSIRYRVPLMPIVCIFAAGGIVILMKRLVTAKRAAAARV